jgi:hypothetical protein
MALAATHMRGHVSARQEMRWTSLLALCIAAVAVYAAFYVYRNPSLISTFRDTDDATRLVQVRELINGASWFDTTLHRFGGPEPLVSHWSRLIDLPLAVMLAGLELVLPQAQAETIVRVVWPLMLLVTFLYLMARIVERQGGRKAMLVAMALTLVSYGTQQFLPGRIDHHNAIILLTVIGIFLLARSLDAPDSGWGAGVLLGLGIAIGYEPVVLTVAALAFAVLARLAPGRSLLGPSRAALTFAATLATAFAFTTAPDNFPVIHCDALSLNLIALATAAAFGTCVVQAFEERLSLGAKLAILAATGAAGLLLFARMEPACLAGPFGQVDPAVIPLWLSRVSETRSFLQYDRLPEAAIANAAFLAAGVYGAVKLWRLGATDEMRFAAAMMLIAIPLAVWQLKFLPYALYLAVPLIAVAFTRPSPPKPALRPGKRGSMLVQVLGLAVIAGAAWLLMSSSKSSLEKFNAQAAAIGECTEPASMAPLAALPRGLAVADVDLGPFIVAMTPLDVLSAPYHRIGRSIIAAHEILNAEPAEAERRLREVGATYVITCKNYASTKPSRPDQRDALQTLLFAGKPPAFLTPMALDEPTPIRVWRVVPQGAP